MSDCTTAVVLAGGSGTRMRRASAAELDPAQRAMAELGVKAMIPDARGRPLLDHILSSLADAGVVDACLVLGATGGVVREHYALVPPRRLRLGYATQPEPRGTADALLAAEHWVAGRGILVLNADNLYPVEALRALVTLDGPGLVAFDRDALIRESNIEAERIGTFAVVELGPDDTLTGITEKPGTVSHPAWISMNLWRFGPEIFDACRAVLPSPRGELELPHAVALALHHGMRLHAVRMHAGVLDLSRRGDVADVARRLADRDIAP